MAAGPVEQYIRESIGGIESSVDNVSVGSLIEATQALGPEEAALEGVLAAAGVVAKNAARELTAAEEFFEGAVLHPRVLKQIESGDNHAFPALIDKLAADSGKVTINLDSQGTAFFMLTVRGVRNGEQGTFEYIKNSANVIYHHFFRGDKVK